MSGICGHIYKKNQNPKAAQTKAMVDLTEHRGQNMASYFHEKNVAMGCMQKEFFETACQATIYKDRFVAVYDGTIFNACELGKELIKDGYSFTGQGETEIVLAAYDKWGEACVSHFLGMWSLAIFDKHKNQVFCSRDRFGIKQFYYSDGADSFRFASEIKQLLTENEAVYVNQPILMDFLVSGLSGHTDQTFFREVYSLPGGNNLLYDLDSNKIRKYRYYSILLNENIGSLGEEEAISIFQDELNRSVKLCLSSGGRIAALLSGGLDSSGIAGIAAKFLRDSGKRLVSIHARSTEKKSDERAFAEKVAKFCDIELHIITPSLADYKNCLDKVVFTQEEPFGDPSVVMQYLVMKKVRELGCNVLLDGQGGDEVLLGYERYYPAYLLSLPIGQRIKGFWKAWENSKLKFWEVLAYCLYFTNHHARKAVYKKRFRFIKPDVFGDFRWLKENALSYLSINRLQDLEITTTQLPRLLRYAGKNSAFHSIESRLPFLDHRLLETALSTNNVLKIRDGWTKYLLRRALENTIPQDVIWRKNKMGFEAPVNSWLNATKNEMIESVKGSSIVASIVYRPPEYERLDNKILWQLYSIAKWEKAYKVCV